MNLCTSRSSLQHVPGMISANSSVLEVESGRHAHTTEGASPSSLLHTCESAGQQEMKCSMFSIFLG